MASWFHLLWAVVFALVALATAAYALGVYRIRKSLRRKATHVVTVCLLTVFSTIRSTEFFIRAFDMDYLPHRHTGQSPWVNLVVFVVPAVALHALYTVRAGRGTKPSRSLCPARARPFSLPQLRVIAAVGYHTFQCAPASAP